MVVRVARRAVIWWKSVLNPKTIFLWRKIKERTSLRLACCTCGCFSEEKKRKRTSKAQILGSKNILEQRRAGNQSYSSIPVRPAVLVLLFRFCSVNTKPPNFSPIFFQQFKRIEFVFVVMSKFVMEAFVFLHFLHKMRSFQLC